MRVILFGATGMIGQGVLRECLLSDTIQEIVVVGRSRSGVTHPKLREIVHADVFDLGPVEGELTGFDACFFCLGVSSAGMTEAAYRRVTLELTLAVARTLVRGNPGMTFVYVSGAGTDSSGEGRTMWARVKGETENALLRLPFQHAVMFRPALIQPMHGARSRTTAYRLVYVITRPLLPLLTRLFPRWVTTTERLGRAMIVAASDRGVGPIVEGDEINRLGTL